MRRYDQDYAGWAEDTAQAIAEGRWDAIDREALLDEVESLSKTEQHRLESALRILLIHLIKVKYQPEKHTRSWDLSIAVQRRHIARSLKESPSLRGKLPQIMEDAYLDARYDTEAETGLLMEIFPETCEWTVAEVAGED